MKHEIHIISDDGIPFVFDTYESMEQAKIFRLMLLAMYKPEQVIIRRATSE